MVDMTEQPGSQIDAEAFSVRRSIHISAPLTRVWTAITDPRQISLWFGEARLNGSGVGASGTLTWPDHGSTPFRIEAIDEPHSISYRWNEEPSTGEPVITDASTVFTFTLESRGGGTQLTVVETGFDITTDPAAHLESHRGGWDFELDELITLLESPA